MLGKGRVGKKTTTANIGLSLARLGFPVIAIDADVGLHNLDLLIGLENRVNYTLVEVLNGDCRLNQALVRDKCWSRLRRLWPQQWRWIEEEGPHSLYYTQTLISPPYKLSKTFSLPSNHISSCPIPYLLSLSIKPYLLIDVDTAAHALSPALPPFLSSPLLTSPPRLSSLPLPPLTAVAALSTATAALATATLASLNRPHCSTSAPTTPACHHHCRRTPSSHRS
ncbi:hypothetical protein Scep_004931 [Stephania cephalantha]|uniref:CobQ/CobB/MinD/ParA nucleotide binding domain-containing protein n=1 Tax=Stephania cephalantha TaxID=152367 RepID=A0AAP0KV29_9MAGN